MFPKTQSTKAQLKKISDEIDQDPNPLKNLGTYSTPMMEREAFKIMCKSINKNLVDSSAYTHIGKHKDELLKMISHLLHGKDVRGEITSGSSESIYIAMMAHKLKWIEKHGQPTKKLNFVVGIHTHNTFEKFAKFFDVEMRSIPLNSKHSIDTSVVEEYIDDHTICVVGIACSTELAVTDNLKALDSIARKHRIPLHIDGASGAFYLPFVAPDFKFDFRLKSVESINISGHKFGLTFPGVGCILIKNTAIPKELFSEINYLASGELKHINLLCTQNAAFMEGWHYTIKNLGFNGLSL